MLLTSLTQDFPYGAKRRSVSIGLDCQESQDLDLDFYQ